MGWIGIYGPVALASIGSAIGCTIAGKAACGAVLEVDGGYGRYIGLSVLPSSIVIYGIVIMFTLNRTVAAATSPGLFGVGALDLPTWIVVSGCMLAVAGVASYLPARRACHVDPVATLRAE